jgi:uncharacterized oxidoreductase
MDFKGKTAIVTGGGAGLGLAITRALHGAGAHVVIVGRDKSRLDEVRAELKRVTAIRTDLLDRAERNKLVDTLHALDKPIDVLVNNAGLMQYFPLDSGAALMSLDRELELDLHAPIHLATALLPHLLTRPEAAIINVTTGLVYAPFGAAPGYSAAKAGLHAFTRSLRWQTRHSKLRVVELLPPTIDTAMSAHYGGQKLDPKRVAGELLRGLSRNLTQIRPGQSKALYAMSRIAPELIFRLLNETVERARHRGSVRAARS